ncbi:uncharacterized protein LOC142234310 [Haematobia irritans]|uniref:Putative secreted protein n=1 Tax=Haematobia irritans TaxID=7368 RepID=A0A1L8EIU1_HAEIR
MAIKTLTVLLVVSYLSSSYAFNPFAIGRLNVEISDAKFQCDKMICPSSAERCVVTKQKDPKNPKVLVRTNTCISRTGVELRKKTWLEGTDASSKVNVRIEGHRYVGYTPYKPQNSGKKTNNNGNNAKENKNNNNNNWNNRNFEDEEQNEEFNKAVDELMKDFDM